MGSNSYVFHAPVVASVILLHAYNYHISMKLWWWKSLMNLQNVD